MRISKLSTALLALALAAGLGCTADQSPTAQSSAAPEALSLRLPLGGVVGGVVGGVGGVVNGAVNTVSGVLLACSPLPYAKSTAVVGPQGGRIAVGPHTLTIPAGALAQPVQITAETGLDAGANSVRFSPHGLQFQAPATLELSYANCVDLPLLSKRVAYTDDGLSILELLRSLDLTQAKRVSAPISHFSKYAVAY